MRTFRVFAPVLLVAFPAWAAAECGGAATPCCQPKGLVKQAFTVSRDDTHHEAWPYLCFASNGELICSYAEADMHGGGAMPRTLVRISKDLGRTWSEPIVVDTLRSPTGRNFMMCRWVIRLNNGTLLLASDFNGTSPLAPPGAPHNWSNDPVNSGDSGAWLYRSLDNGRTWSGPQKTYCLTVSLTMKQLSTGRILLGGSHYHCEGDYWSQVVYYSQDNGKTWYGPVTVLDDPKYSCAEGDMVEMPGGVLVMYLRSAAPAQGAYKMISTDGGMTWQGPYAAGRHPIVGRVAAGRLTSGEVLVMHRVGRSAGCKLGFAFFVESLTAALSRIPYDPKAHQPTAQSWGMIDVDRHGHPDGGYGSWVELPDGDIYAVQYITDDAPVGKPQIRGYLISRKKLLNANGT